MVTVLKWQVWEVNPQLMNN
uniref:Uncharacterized protein n=1 Tax=Anguilla anguilla TaxID=7936 RepID=A0A0E9UJC5_ANGAN